MTAPTVLRAAYDDGWHRLAARILFEGCADRDAEFINGDWAADLAAGLGIETWPPARLLTAVEARRALALAHRAQARPERARTGSRAAQDGQQRATWP